MSTRLFEQSDNNDPDLTNRIAFGKAGTATGNMSFTNFLAWLLTKLGFLKTASNLSDLASASTARSNLGVYSTSQVDSALNGKANIYPASGGAIKTNNTISFTPSASYHPATKKYVDDNTLLPLFKGYTEIDDVASGVDVRTVVLGTTLSTSNYVVICSLKELSAANRIEDIVYGTKDYTTTSFKVVLKEYASNVQDLRLYFMIYAASGFTLCNNS
jgi:hypothetical protein